jgi:2-dehydro-3-deoxyphosphogluconate aldolase / (4S)-4-hydroxy-2-oxoglutarate aldolase
MVPTPQPSEAHDRFLDILREDRLVAVIRAGSIAEPRKLAETLAGAGIRCVEFTLTTEGALDAIRVSVGSGALVGAGTLLDPDQAEAAIAAGAGFLVSPALRPDLVEVAGGSDIPLVLGAFSPTEVVDGMEAGATALKLFPAQVGGPGYVKDLLSPLPDARLIPSGRIGPDDVQGFLEAGALAVYAGSALAPASAVETGDVDEIARRAERFRTRLGPPDPAARSR